MEHTSEHTKGMLQLLVMNELNLNPLFVANIERKLIEGYKHKAQHKGKLLKRNGIRSSKHTYCTK